MDQVTEPAEIVRAAGTILREPGGSVLMLKRVDTGEWAWPGGCIEGDETAEQAAYRECWEETGRRLGDTGKFLMQRVKDGVDFTTYLVDIDAPFVPVLNAEHSAFAWLDPEETLMESRSAPAAIADSAEIETPPLLNSGDEIDGFDEPADEDDIDDETADLALSMIEDLDRRLSAIEEADDEPDPQLDSGSLEEPTKTPVVVHGASSAADLKAALDAGFDDWDD